MAVGKGSGTTLTHAGMVYKMTNIAWDGHSIPAIRTGALDATIASYEGGNLIDWGTVTADIEFDGTQAIPTPGGAAGNLVIDVRAEGAGSVFTALAFLREMSIQIPNEDVMTGTLVFRLTAAFGES